MLVAIATHAPRSIASIRPVLPNALAALVDQMLAKQPEQRLATAQEFAERLLPFAGVDLVGLTQASAGEISHFAKPEAATVPIKPVPQAARRRARPRTVVPAVGSE